MNSRFRSRLLASTLFVGGALLSQPLLAQDTPADQPAEETRSEDIVVTGSLIANPNLEKSSPISVIGADEIQLQQANTAEELLRDVPGAASSVGSNVNNGQGGSSFVDLRGLGISRNVVLLDSMRLVPARADGAADLNMIPLALIERVDVLTGGASTTYGADAVSGVVNFVTKRDFSGLALDGSEQITQRGDGNIFRVDLTLGANFEDGRGNAVLSLGYQQADPIYQGSRAFSRASLSSTTGNVSGSGTTVPGVFSLGALGPRQLNVATGGFKAENDITTFNFNPYNLLQTPFERFSIYGAARYEVTDAIEVYAQGQFSTSKTAAIVAPTGTFGNAYLIPVSNPFLTPTQRATFCANNDFDGNPRNGNQTLTPAECTAAAGATSASDPNYREFTTAISRRFVEAGVRRSAFTTTFWQQKVGFRGNISDNVTFDLFGTYGRSELKRENLGYGLNSRVQQALRATNTGSCLNTSNGCVPINLFGDQGTLTSEMFAFVNGASASDTQYNSLAQFRGVVSGDLGAVSEGVEPIGFAIGGEYRRQKAKREADALSQIPGEVLGLGGSPQTTDNTVSVKEIFGEIIAPIVSDAPFFHSLTLELGARYSDYNTTGGAFTYKVGGSWEPVSGLKFRGNYNRATRSPTIFELYASRQVGLNNQNFDPCQRAFPTTNPILRDICIAQGAPASLIGFIPTPSAAQVNVTQLGNPDLDVEKADTYTVGFVYQPDFIPGLSFTVDYYNITVKDAITAPTIDDQLRECFGGSSPTTINPAPGAATSLDCTEIRRDPVTGSINGNPATTGGIPLPLSNQGTIKTSGIDASLNYRRDLDFATLSVNFNLNWTNSSKFRSKPGSILRECVGYYSVNCGGPGNGTSNFGAVGSIQPEFSWNMRTTLSFEEDVDVSLLWRHISAVDVEPVVASAFLEKFRHIKAYDWFDLTTRFHIGEHLTLTATVANLFDKKPPVVGNTIGSTAFNSGNTYPSTYDSLGRRFAFGANIKF